MTLFSNSLIKWYSTHQRSLPWRSTNDPYIIWISEIILQQTRVKQGLGYFYRFVERFPNIRSLAEASEDEVMTYWQGLGYYSRARNLHAAAISMNNVFPNTYNEVLALKGVGQYTAAAICAFAFDMPYAVVDGNVYRVLSRYLGIDVPIDTTLGKKLFSELAQQYLDKNNPATYNQAIMDFGAIQCTPTSPKCSHCPFVDSCSAFLTNKVGILPIKSKRNIMQDRFLNYFIVRSKECLFIRQRKEDDIWKNLYEIPLVESKTNVSVEDLISLNDFKTMFDGNENIVFKVLENRYKQVLSHRILYINLYEVITRNDIDDMPGYMKVNICDLQDFAMSKVMKMFLEKYI